MHSCYLKVPLESAIILGLWMHFFGCLNVIMKKEKVKHPSFELLNNIIPSIIIQTVTYHSNIPLMNSNIFILFTKS